MYGVETFVMEISGEDTYDLVCKINTYAEQMQANVRQIVPVSLSGAVDWAIVVFERPVDMDGEFNEEEI